MTTVASEVIERGHAIKDKNGEYYEITTDNIIDLSEDKLILLEREGRQRIFKKVAY